MERNIFAWGMTTRKAVFAKIPRGGVSSCGYLSHGLYRRTLRIDRDTVGFSSFPISRSMAFIDASDEEQAVFMGHDD